MIVYKCMFSTDEMISDSYGIRPVMDGEDEVPGMFEVESRNIAKGGDNVDIGCGNAFGGGEEEDGPADSGVETVNNIVDGFQLNEMNMSKADLKEYLKGYFQRVRAAMKAAGKPVEEIKAMMGNASIIAKFLITKANDLQFYLGANFDVEGAMAFAIYKEGATTPTFMYIECGLIAEKRKSGALSQKRILRLRPSRGLRGGRSPFLDARARGPLRATVSPRRVRLRASHGLRGLRGGGRPRFLDGPPPARRVQGLRKGLELRGEGGVGAGVGARAAHGPQRLGCVEPRVAHEVRRRHGGAAAHARAAVHEHRAAAIAAAATLHKGLVDEIRGGPQEGEDGGGRGVLHAHAVVREALAERTLAGAHVHHRRNTQGRERCEVVGRGEGAHVEVEPGNRPRHLEAPAARLLAALLSPRHCAQPNAGWGERIAGLNLYVG
eukprot:CAMPEP_0198426466 /NCGR_PEP_ID=MMETSP1452-20131203/5259_1 /TAXON_ID=1181717 /ORGANISM="Synchroma pusillum, Strain CCMP3072" /LENGTH=435 /DNA_ID=CAMNT_0044146839 /DNA_START=24 /DNA_END=1328 /DNA_ORIENTATION=-